MGKSKKRKTKIKTITENTIPKEEIFPIPSEDQEADHVIDGYKTHDLNVNEYFNDDLGIDQQDYEVEQEKYDVQSEDLQPIAVDRYFKRFGKSRRTPR